MIFEINTFKIFLATENIFGLYRNFDTFRKPVKVLVIIRIFTEVVLALYSVQERNITEEFTEYLMNIQSYSSILLSCYYSKSYLKLIGYVNFNHVNFKDNNVYNSRLTMCLKFAIFLWCGYFVSVCIVLFTFFYYDDVAEEFGYLTTLNKMLIHLRFYLQYAFFYCILCTISEQLKFITRFIRSGLSVDSSTVIIVEKENTASKLSNKFEECRLNYLNMKNIVNLFNKIFGIQLGMSYTIIVTRNVAIFYELVFLQVKGNPKRPLNLVGRISFYIATMYSFMLTIMVARAAQAIQNSARDLTCALQQLRAELNALPDDTQQKEVNRLLRVVLTRPMFIKTFGGIYVNMTVIPSCVGLVTSYTVVALQFNNVV